MTPTPILHLVLAVAGWAAAHHPPMRAGHDLTSPTPVSSQPPIDQASTWLRADAAYAAERWAEAADLFTDLTVVNPDHAMLWFRLGTARERTGDTTAAIAAYDSARDLGVLPFECGYRLARLHAQSGASTIAIDELERALAAGSATGGTIERIRDEPAFAMLATDRRFARLIGAPPPLADRLARRRADLDALVGHVERTHYDPFHRISRPRWEQEVAALRTRLDDLDDLELVGELARLVALVGDGHTRIEPLPGEPERLLPLFLYDFADGLVIVASARADLVGARIDAIDGIPIAEIWQRAAPFIAHDNRWQLRHEVPRLLTKPDFLRLLGIGENLPRIELRLATAGGRSTVAVETVPLADLLTQAAGYLAATPHFDERVPVPLWPSLADGASAPIPLWRQHPYRAYWLAHDPARKLVYVQYNDARDEPDEPFDAFVGRLFALVEAERVEAMVLDLRLNEGGQTYHSIPLVKRLSADPRLDRRGHLFTILGRRTNSSAVRLAAQLEMWTSTLFVGEPSGQGPNAYGGLNLFRLPYSGLLLQVSNRLWLGARTSDDHRAFIAPDLRAELTAADYAANRDPAMELIHAFRAEQAASEPTSAIRSR